MNFARFDRIEAGETGFVYLNPGEHIHEGLRIAAGPLDRLTGVLDDAALAEVMAASDRAAALDTLIRRTLDGGAPDNVTAILIGVREATRLDPVGSRT